MANTYKGKTEIEMLYMLHDMYTLIDEEPNEAELGKKIRSLILKFNEQQWME